MRQKRVFTLRLDKLQIREKMWILGWVVVVLAVGDLKLLHHPRAEKIRETLEAVEGLDQEKTARMAKQPNLRQRQSQIATLKEEISVAYKELTGVEKDLLDAQDVDQLLDSLIKDRNRFEMRLNSIRPIQQKEPSTAESANPGGSQEKQAPYRKLHVQLDAFSTFQGLVNYIAFLEEMRAYQQVEGIQVKVEGREVSRPHAVLLVTVLMG